MSRVFRTGTILGIGLIMLLLGWQIGQTQNMQKVMQLQHQVDALSGVTASGTVISDPKRDANIEMLWSVWRLLLANYVSPTDLDPNAMVQGAVRGLVEAIGDPYTLYMSAKENTDFHQSLSGHLQGIGAELAVRDNHIVVASPLQGSPAQKAGLLPGDIVVGVNGEDVEFMSLNDIVSRVRGPKGTSVVVEVVRAGKEKPLSFTITRDDIRVPSTKYEVKTGTGGKIGYLSVYQFGAETIGETRNILQSIHPKDLKGLILDVRFNGGGYLDGAIDMTSFFVQDGTAVSVERRSGDPERILVTGETILPTIPLVVLQNNGSASASEIVAGALQDHKRAFVIGEDSFGKGTVQEIIDLPDGSSLRVTTARWLTPNGKNLGKEHIHPDLYIVRTPEQIASGVDPQLEAAMQWLLLGKKMKEDTRPTSSAGNR